MARYWIKQPRLSHHQLLLASCLAALAVGVFFRFQQIHLQVLLDDEWHSIHTLTALRYSKILASFGFSDHCIPCTLLFKGFFDGFGLSEMSMRALSLAAGVLTLMAVAGWLFANGLRAQAVGVTWLLGISPILVYFSRSSRPYAIILLLCIVAIWAAFSWERTRSRKYLAVFIPSVALGAWANPLYGPVLMSPLLFFLFENALKHRSFRATLSASLPLFAIGLLCLAAAALFLLPPLINDFDSVGVKVGWSFPDATTILEATHIFVGSGSAVVAFLFSGLALLGSIRLYIEKRRWFFFGLTALVVLALTLGAMRPLAFDTGLVFARYTLILLPALVLCWTWGLLWIAATVSATPSVRSGLVAICLALPLIGNPIWDFSVRPNSYSQHVLFINDPRPGPGRLGVLVDRMLQSSYWDERIHLDAEPGTSIAVAPWRFEAPLSALAVIERRTGYRTIPAFIRGFCAGGVFGELAKADGFGFRNVFYLETGEALSAEPVSLIIWKKQWYVDPDAERILAERHIYPWALEQRYPQCADAIAEKYGEPIFEDEHLMVFRNHAGNR